MIVKNLKCPQCGGIKINKLTTGYIYCDFCSALMGYDMKNMQEETMDVFSYSKMSDPNQKEYIETAQQMGKALKEENINEFIDSQIKMKELEFDLFPKRFSPKAKQQAYRTKQLNFSRAMLEESIENGYFRKFKAFNDKISPISSKLKIRIEDGKTVYEYDENFEEYLKVLNEYVETSVKESMQMKCMSLNPEPNSLSYDILYKQSVDAFLQVYDTETTKKAIKFLNLESEYITIDDIQMSDVECIACKTKLKVPAGSKSMVCETCGNINNFEEKKIQCISCGAPISFENNNTCEFCGAVHLSFERESKNNKTDEINKVDDIKQPKKKSGGLFGRIFGG